ncbi:hypothetical protein E6W39_02465 [Kitasatospora acidiphila]|uniref:Uncharacterized protein n=1 Tax=Kitasatospora acidiphila TaxID=2567942 RepID=A0A540VX65_9ACTN|nr:hypothetical protein [Kitasatospora acidiphila]TQF01307.1 hypothetical protein E6W39_02465 [Kitasatospora acidiphila]
MEDRVRLAAGVPQVFGTQLGWSADGRPDPLPIVEPAGVGGQPAAWGFESLEAYVERLRARA